MTHLYMLNTLCTVDDLQQLVGRAKADSSVQFQLRDVLHMGRDGDKWRSLCRLLESKVVRDDEVPRAWLMPNAGQCAFGLLFGCQRGQVDFADPMGEWQGTWARLREPMTNAWVACSWQQSVQREGTALKSSKDCSEQWT